WLSRRRDGPDPKVDALAGDDRTARLVAVDGGAIPKLAVDADGAVDEAPAVGRSMPITANHRDATTAGICPRQTGKYRHALRHHSRRPPMKAGSLGGDNRKWQAKF